MSVGRALSRRSLLVKEASRHGSVPDMCLTPRVHPATHPAHVRLLLVPRTPSCFSLYATYTLHLLFTYRAPSASALPCVLTLVPRSPAVPPPHTATVALCGESAQNSAAAWGRNAPALAVVSDEGPDSFELRVWT